MSDADRSGLGSERPSASSTNPLNRLTQREREVLALVADGNANKAIGRKIGISELTVKDHLKVIFLKLDVDSRTRAAGVWFEFVG